MTFEIKNPRKNKIFEYLSAIVIVFIFGGMAIYYLTKNQIVAISGFTIGFFLFGTYLAIALHEYLKEKRENNLRGFEKQWYTTNRIFGSFGSITLILVFFSIPLAWFGGLEIIAIVAAFLFMTFVISMLVIMAYFAIRKPSVMKEDFESAKYMIIPVVVILLLSAIARSQLGMTGIITVFVIALIVIGIAHWWQKRMK